MDNVGFFLHSSRETFDKNTPACICCSPTLHRGSASPGTLGGDLMVFALMAHLPSL